MIKTAHQPFWIFTLALIIGLIVPILIQDGMFMDGVLYTSVAKNLGNDIGSFWFPIFSKNGLAGLKTFHEHPPLAFGIQAIFFKILGNSMYTERIYSLLTAFINATLIVLIWRLIFQENERLKSLAWFPIILWIIIPVAHWAFRHNMQENTMGAFNLFAVFWGMKAMKQNHKQYMWLLLSAVATFLASFAKGIPGFFTLTIIFAYWLATKKISFKQMIIYSLFVFTTIVIIYGLILLNDDAFKSLSTYFNNRLLHRIVQQHTTGNRMYSLIRLAQELLPSMLIAGGLFLFGKLKYKEIGLIEARKKYIFFFLLMGLFAATPLMLTLVQKGFYLTPSLPYFAIALAILAAPVIVRLIDNINLQHAGFKIWQYTSLILFVLVMGISIAQVGKTSRDAEALHDIYLFGEIIPPHSAVSIPKYMWDDWGLQTYMVRYNDISLDYSADNTFYINEKSNPVVSSQYNLIELSTQKYNLYRKKE